ncbi:hypothetical protein JOM56_013620, partial [Amanita muscaria]
PLDGAKGFLRGEQYAVCLALVIDEQVKVGVIGCPLILANPEKPECIFVPETDVESKGIPPRALQIKGQTPDSLGDVGSSSGKELVWASISLCHNVRDSAHSSYSFNARVSTALSVTHPPIRMNGQAKYGCLARGDGAVYLRMPTGVGYQEKFWVRHRSRD